MAIRHHRRRRQMSEINVVPYIDVMLVLLVIFMVTAPLLTVGVKVDLPETDAEQLSSNNKNDEPFLVVVDREGKFYLNESQDAVENINDIRIKAMAVLRNNPNTEFQVKGDANANYELIAQAMTLLQKAGAESIGLVFK